MATVINDMRVAEKIVMRAIADIEDNAFDGIHHISYTDRMLVHQRVKITKRIASIRSELRKFNIFTYQDTNEPTQLYAIVKKGEHLRCLSLRVIPQGVKIYHGELQLSVHAIARIIYRCKEVNTFKQAINELMTGVELLIPAMLRITEHDGKDKRYIPDTEEYLNTKNGVAILKCAAVDADAITVVTWITKKEAGDNQINSNFNLVTSLISKLHRENGNSYSTLIGKDVVEFKNSELYSLIASEKLVKVHQLVPPGVLYHELRAAFDRLDEIVTNGGCIIEDYDTIIKNAIMSALDSEMQKTLNQCIANAKETLLEEI